MKKIYIVLIILVFALAIGFSFFRLSPDGEEKKPADLVLPQDYKNATYTIDGVPTTLTNSASKIVTRYFGNEVRHDLNDDGREDVAFIITQETGGSGTFFYFVAALNTPAGYVGSHAVFLGDRIAPQTTHMDEGVTSAGTQRQNVIVVNYATRLPEEPFTARPSQGKSLWLKLDPATMQFAEVAQNFEGESR